MDRARPLRRGPDRGDPCLDRGDRDAHLVARTERLPRPGRRREHPARSVSLRLADDSGTRRRTRRTNASLASSSTRRCSRSSTSSRRVTRTETTSTPAHCPTCCRATPRSSAPRAANTSPPSGRDGSRTPHSGSATIADFARFRIEAVPAYHEGAPEAVGYIVRNGAYAVFYHSGDSRRVQGMAEAVAPHGVDVAFVPINGALGNMDGTDAARLAYEAGAKHRDPLPPRDVPVQHGGNLALRRGVRPDRAGVPSSRAGERITIDYGFETD